MHGEQITDTLVNTLQAQIPGRIDAMNAEPGVTLTYPKGYWFAGREQIGADQYPAIEVTVPDVDLSAFDIGFNAADAVYQAHVITWVSQEGPDPPEQAYELMVRRSYRLTRACAMVCLGRNAAGPASTAMSAAFRFRLTTGPEDTTPAPHWLMGGLLVVTYAISDPLD